MRDTIDISRGWVFRRGRASRRWLNGAGAGDPVDLPHCWNDRDGFLKGVAYYRGTGAYRWEGTVETPTGDGSKWFLESDGFYGTGKLYVNGCATGAFDGQYLGLRRDITPCLRQGRLSRIGVTMTNHCASDVLPGSRMPDFLLYGGLSCGMRLVRRPALYCDRRLLAIRCENVLGDAPVVQIDFAVVNGSSQESKARVSWQIHGHDGDAIGEAVPCTMNVQQGETARGSVTFPAAGLQRWHVDRPVLYEVRAELSDGERTVDCMTARFGMRQAEFRTGQGFFLNGKRLPLRGCNRHESMPGFGRALAEEQHREDARLLKDMGMNFVRLSHYPQHPAFLDACDELGILVFAELASWKSVRGGRWLKRAMRQMREMILRDRNRPSVILWGMGNESRSRSAYRQLGELAKDLDPGRPVTYAENHLYRARRENTLDVCDVWGCNYELDFLDEAAGYARTGNAIVTECSNTPYAERGNRRTESAQEEKLWRDLASFGGKPHVAGYAMWCFNDYATFRKKRYRRFSGLVDAWRLPKAASVRLRESHAGNVPPSCPELWEAVAPGGGRAAARLEIRPQVKELSVGKRETIGILVLAVDEDGRKDDHWSGDVHVSVDGPARLHTLGCNGAVWVRAGVGRCFIAASGAPGTIRIEAGHQLLRTGAAPVSIA